MLKQFSPRIYFAAIFLWSVLMMLGAYFFFQLYLGLMPCPLCVSQRIFVILAGSLALVAALHAPKGWGESLYSVLISTSVLAGIAVASRQLWLQSLPEDKVPACGPTLGYLMDFFPWQDVVNAMFLGEGSCAEVKWQLLGLSIPAWTLLAFVVMLVLLAAKSIFAKRS